jgi:hypothetical protein
MSWQIFVPCFKTIKIVKDVLNTVERHTIVACRYLLSYGRDVAEIEIVKDVLSTVERHTIVAYRYLLSYGRDVAEMNCTFKLSCKQFFYIS